MEWLVSVKDWFFSLFPSHWDAWDVAMAVAIVTVTSAVVSLLIVAIVLARLPADYFVNPQARMPIDRHPVLKFLFAVFRNAVGYVLIVVGMLLSLPGIPGQGILTILMGVMLVDFPGKHRAERWMLTRHGVLTAVNALRKKMGKAPLVEPQHPEKAVSSGVE
jgi:hypothetical protein